MELERLKANLERVKDPRRTNGGHILSVGKAYTDRLGTSQAVSTLLGLWALRDVAVCLVLVRAGPGGAEAASAPDLHRPVRFPQHPAGGPQHFRFPPICHVISLHQAAILRISAASSEVPGRRDRDRAGERSLHRRRL